MSNNTCKKERLILRARYFIGNLGKFSDWENLFCVPKDDININWFQHHFRLGGNIVICTNAISKQQRCSISNELINDNNSLFRIYPIQGNNFEPRMNCTFHYNATNEFDKDQQPGYRYGSSIIMKSHPIQKYKNLYNLANDMENDIKDINTINNNINNDINDDETFWNVGVTAVLYRDGRDKMGYHADNDQGETIIATVIIESPNETRKVCIKPTHTRPKTKRNRKQKTQTKTKTKRKQYCYYKDGDEEIEIYVQAGDYYVMDGEMQKHYLHCVPTHAASAVCNDWNNEKKVKKTAKDNKKDDDDDYSSSNNNNNNTAVFCDHASTGTININTNTKIKTREIYKTEDNNDNDNNKSAICDHDNTAKTIKTADNYMTDGGSIKTMTTEVNNNNKSDLDGGNETIKIDDNNKTVCAGSINSSETIKTKDNDEMNIAVNYNNNIINNSNEYQQQQQRRLVLVFRRGNMVMFDKDSGIPCNNINPRPIIKRQFGHVDKVFEGYVYDRAYINNMNAHRGFQRGVSGNKDEGCDAIIVSGLREDQLGWDEFDFLCYAAHTKVGAKSLLQSAHLHKPIRVFRSGVLQNPFRAIMMRRYRYDGLYTIYLVHCIDQSKQEEFVIERDKYEEYRDMNTENVYLFLLCRNIRGCNKYDNRYQSNDYIDRCIENYTMIPGARSCFQDMIINRPISSPFQEFLFLLMLRHSPINRMDEIQNSVPASKHKRYKHIAR